MARHIVDVYIGEDFSRRYEVEAKTADAAVDIATEFVRDLVGASVLERALYHDDITTVRGIDAILGVS